jgi:hypothetical protein
MIRPVYNIYHSRYEYGGPFPGPRYLNAMYNNLEAVRDFLVAQGASRNLDRYETKPDSRGSFSLYWVDVELDLCKS